MGNLRTEPDDVLTITVEDYDMLNETAIIVAILRRAVLRDEYLSNGMLRAILGMGAKPRPENMKGE